MERNGRVAVGRGPTDEIAGSGGFQIEGVTAGSLTVRLADSEYAVRAAQELRYRVFFGEQSALPTPEVARTGRDSDAVDAFCDHLLVWHRPGGDSASARTEEVVGTYRLLRRSVAERRCQFLTTEEFDIEPILDHPEEVLELGRACIAAPYRHRATMTLLWRGVAVYVHRYGIGLMFGCASLPGIDPDELAEPLSYLYHRHLAPPEYRVSARPGCYVNMCRLAKDRVDDRSAYAALPPLVKGYLRLGGFVGDGAVIDHRFQTTDVCVVVKTKSVTEKYYQHYMRDLMPRLGSAS